jgi:UDP-glucose 4-epimerase
METGKAEVMHCGYGQGSSLLDVVTAAKKVVQTDLRIEETGRRAGDASPGVADSAKLRRLTGWQTQHDDWNLSSRQHGNGS